MEEKFIKKTRALCPICVEVVPAQIVERGEIILIKKDCPVHGKFENPHLLRSPQVYYPLNEIHKNRAAIPEGLILKVTTQCNQQCNYCYMDANNIENYEPQKEEIIAKARAFNGDVIYLSGGEPTMRDDLFEIIRAISKIRRRVILFTNGKKLADAAYVKKLRKTGLDAVILQCNSLNEAHNIEILGEALVGVKKSAVENMKTVGLAAMLYVNVVEGVNDSTQVIEDLFLFALENDNVRLLFFNPLWNIGRKKKASSLDSSSMLTKVTKILSLDEKYFVKSISFSTYVFEILRKLKIRKGIKQPPCSLSCYLIRHKNKYVRLDELFDLSRIVAYLKAVDRVLDQNKGRVYNVVSLMTCSAFYKIGAHILFNRKMFYFVAKLMGEYLRSPLRFSSLYFMFCNVLSIMVGQFPDKNNIDFSLFKTCNMYTEADGNRSMPTCLREVLADENKLLKNQESCATSL